MKKEVSRRARRMDRHHRMGKQGGLNLVSLMDIFTILVFFLLVNSSNTQQLPSNKELTLPQSVAKKAPEETLVIMITKDDIIVQGRKVADIGTLLASTDEENVPALKEELEFLAQGLSPQQQKTGGRITIMGDENISYELVRRILKTCQEANFTKIAFAATQIANKPSGG
ncbi:hypothetical protein TDB9533_03503 [Thalassocella blandensis]|nr:hypothetical protein TDB9533_03503 [Thalassocella blandensis]